MNGDLLQLLSSGVSPANSEYINSKIRVANQIALFFFFLGVIYAGFSLVVFPSLALFPVMGSVVSAIAFVLNRQGRHRAARFLLSIGAVSLTSLYHAFIVPAGEPFVLPLYFACFGFSLYPWILFDIREKGLLTGGVSVGLALLLGQGWLNRQLEVSIDTSVMRTTAAIGFTYLFATLVVLTCMYFLQRINLDMENKRDALLQKMSNEYQSEHKGRQESEKLRGELEAKLLQSQKMEAIGRLAGGVAHDLNNLLTPIIGYGALTLEDLPSDTPLHRRLTTMHHAALRAKDLVHQLLAFSRKQALEVSAVDINEMLRRFHALIRVSLWENIEVSLSLQDDLPLARADERQVEQVVMNLVVNAQDAMPAGGKLTIETTVAVLDEAYCALHVDSSPGRFVMIVVSDNGVGMDRETRERIFEPFYTTKGELGTGLGLSIAYGIVKQHGGNILVYSERNQGTTFKIYLPMAGAQLRPKPEKHLTSLPLNEDRTLLIAEDDLHVRELCESILERLGYHLLSAGSGEEALALIRQHGSAIHLLLTDVIMPDMNGRQLFEAALKEQPQLKVLYMSGYTDNVIAKQGILNEGVNFLSKPFTSQDLSSKLQEVFSGVD